MDTSFKPGLCLGADIDYVKVFDEDKKIHIILAKKGSKQLKKEKVYYSETFKGSALGQNLQTASPFFSDYKEKGAFQIFNDGYVTTDSGTGVVHLAPDFGEYDNRVMKEAGLHFNACPVDDKGNFTQPVSDYEGTMVKDADKQIIKDLKEQGKLFDQGVIVHPYPHCPRSNTPLIYRSIPQWYVKVESIKDKIIEANKQIHWVPGHIKEGRFGKWLEGARDWPSREIEFSVHLSLSGSMKPQAIKSVLAPLKSLKNTQGKKLMTFTEKILII